jgi:hypothetical protein
MVGWQDQVVIHLRGLGAIIGGVHGAVGRARRGRIGALGNRAHVDRVADGFERPAGPRREVGTDQQAMGVQVGGTARTRSQAVDEADIERPVGVDAPDLGRQGVVIEHQPVDEDRAGGGTGKSNAFGQFERDERGILWMVGEVDLPHGQSHRQGSSVGGGRAIAGGAKAVLRDQRAGTCRGDVRQFRCATRCDQQLHEDRGGCPCR